MSIFNLFVRRVFEPYDWGAEYLPKIKRFLQIYFVRNNIDWKQYQICDISCTVDDDGLVRLKFTAGSPWLMTNRFGERMEKLEEILSGHIGKKVRVSILEHNIWE